MTFVTVLRSGGVYSPMWVSRLNRQAREHLQPDRVACLEDVFHFAPPDYESLRLIHDWPGWHSKIELFRPGLFTGVCFYSDLDQLICGPIPNLRETLAKALDTCPLLLLDDFFTPSRPATGVIAWRPCAQTERIYTEFAARPVIRDGWQHGDGAHIGKFPHGRLQSIFPNTFGSLKAHKLNSGPGPFKVVCQHGVPKFNDLPPDHWMKRMWVGEA